MIASLHLLLKLNLEAFLFNLEIFELDFVLISALN